MKKAVRGIVLALALGWGSTSPLGAQSYTGTLLVSGQTVTEVGQTYSSMISDSSGVAAVAGARVSLTDPKVVVTGASRNEKASGLWGINAGVLAAEASKITTNGGSVRTSGVGSSAIFATGNSSIDVSDITIATSKESSRGLCATLGGSITAQNPSIVTVGAHSPAIDADSGGGVLVTGGTVRTTGEDSAGISSAGQVRVSGAVLTALGSEAAVIEGKSSITLIDTVLLGSQKDGVMLYQGSTRDSDPGAGTFTMTGGSLTALSGPLFYATNTKAVIYLKQVSLVQKSGLLAQVEAGSWGDSGKNGADLVLNADSQDLRGNLAADPISSITLSLKNGSNWTGAADMEKAARELNVTLDGTSSWTLTADSWVSAFRVQGDTPDALPHCLISGGHTLWYKSSANAWLAGRPVPLADGGSLKPY